MAKVIIGDREFTVELPFHLDILERAADAIDRSNGAVASMQAIQEGGERVPLALMVKALSASVEALHVAIQHSNPDVSLEDIRGLVTLDDVWSVIAALQQALSRSGFAKKGEAPAPDKAPTRRRSKSKSGAS